LRIDASPSDAVHTRVASLFAQDGVRIALDGSARFKRTYALLQGPQGIDPAALEQRMPEARWFGEAIIALAIEPAPADALPHIARALGGPGAPAGVATCEILDGVLLLEFRPAVTHPNLLVRIIDVELKRFLGFRRTHLLSPVPAGVMAAIAADGLQAPEIAPDRILDLLLEKAHVE
jgi:hypothetical protein